MPLSATTPLHPNPYRSFTCRSFYRTFQSHCCEAGDRGHGEAVAPVTQVSRVLVLVCSQPSIRSHDGHPTQVSGRPFSCTGHLEWGTFVGSPFSYHRLFSLRNCYFSPLQGSGVSVTGILTPSCLEPHGREQPLDSSAQSLGLHLLSKTKV